MKAPRSLQVRLLLLVLGAVLLAWLVTAVRTALDARHELDELLDAHLAQAAALLVVQQARDLQEDEHERVQAPALHRYARRVAFQVWHDGQLVLRSSNAPEQPLSAVPGGFADRTIDGQRWRVFAAPGAERDVQVHVGELAGSRSAILQAVLRAILDPLIIVLPLLGLLVWLAVRHGTRPLRRLESALSARDPQALEPVRVEGAPTEIEPVLTALNALFFRISTLMDAERRFTADAAHELRTPIAAIRTQAQVALATAEEKQRRHALHATIAGCDRATRLVEQLLALARLEAAKAKPNNRVDLEALARTVVAEIAGSALDKHQDIALHAEPGCATRGDEVLLGMLLRNLVDNAIRYSPRGARIRVGVARRGPSVVLSVEDSGPGMPPDQIARLGQRFFRVLGTAEEGSGLGWSIVQRIAQVLQVAVQVGRSTQLHGLSVEMVAPADDEPGLGKS